MLKGKFQSRRKLKKEMISCPEKIKEEYGFSWVEHVLAIPSPLVNVTAYKKNGLSNATMQSWCTFVGENGYHRYLYNIHPPRNPETGENTKRV